MYFKTVLLCWNKYLEKIFPKLDNVLHKAFKYYLNDLSFTFLFDAEITQKNMHEQEETKNKYFAPQCFVVLAIIMVVLCKPLVLETKFNFSLK